MALSWITVSKTEEWSDANAAEALRSELFAQKVCGRSLLLRRVLERNPGWDVDAVSGVLNSLEQIGDMTSGPGGMVAVSPLRAVQAVAPWRVVGGAPTWWLCRRGLVLTPGLKRTMEENQRHILENLGGILVSPERWAGLDTVVPAGAWLRFLEERRSGAIEIQGGMLGEGIVPEWYVCGQGWRGKREETGQWLLRWRTAGFWRHGWAGDGRMVMLSTDEAARTKLAIDAEGGCPRKAQFRNEIVVFDGMLPQAEWRWLSCFSDTAAREGRRRSVRVRAEHWPRLKQILENLGMRVETE